jgi:bifunctional DNA-binding transcriptional regulator/antitoxin component of YhaV-PrlF toxin-antitoxin module
MSWRPAAGLTTMHVTQTLLATAFRATVDLEGKTATGVRVPAEAVEALDAGRRPPVRVTIGGHEYRSQVAVRGGEYKLPISAENRAAAGISAGDEVEVTIALDTEERVIVVPADLAAALKAAPDALHFFEALSYSRQRWFVLDIEGARTEDTRRRRVEKAVERLRLGRGVR